MKIKHRTSGAVLFELETDSLAYCVEVAVRAYTNLRDADLRGANLEHTDLYGADLYGADLRGATLTRADLRDANLSGANLHRADLHGADLRRTNLLRANLRRANLRGVDLRGASLSGADLTGADLRDVDLWGVPAIQNIHQTVYAAASARGALDMSTWHTCKTTHCWAGWIVTLAGDAGRALEFCLGPAAAAALICLKSDPNLKRVPDFFGNTAAALKDMRRRAKVEAQSRLHPSKECGE